MRASRVGAVLANAKYRPLSPGVKSSQEIDGGAHLRGTTIARGVFVNLPVAGNVFSPARASLIADEVTIRRIPNSRNVNAELRGNVHLLPSGVYHYRARALSRRVTVLGSIGGNRSVAAVRAP